MVHSVMRSQAIAKCHLMNEFNTPTHLMRMLARFKILLDSKDDDDDRVKNSRKVQRLAPFFFCLSVRANFAQSNTIN